MNMDKDTVKINIRALLSSSSVSCPLRTLLDDFKNFTGYSLPCFEFRNPIEFLESINDTVLLVGNPHNPEVLLVESKKSSHITSLVDRQKKSKISRLGYHNKRLIVPNSKPTLPIKCNNNSSVEQTKKINHSDQSQSLDKAENVFFNKQSENRKNVHESFPEFEIINDQATSLPIAVQVQNCDVASFDFKKSDSCYFEDVSDVESCISFDENWSARSNSGNVLSSSCAFINDGMKNKLQSIIKEYPNGLWCCELPNLFQEKYNSVLDYREFGYTGLIQMLSELPDVFRCVRPGKEDWILFDASNPPSSKETEMMNLQLAGVSSCEVKSNLSKLLLKLSESTDNVGVELDDISIIYNEMFGFELNFEAFGFKSLKSFLETLEGSLLSIYKLNDRYIVAPMLKSEAKFKWEEALPPITAENDIFYEIFPEDVVGPDEKLTPLDLSNHIVEGQLVEVCVAEVWSPSRFYLQLNKYRDEINKFMDDLQNFYNMHLNKYKMPDVTVRPKQVCVCLYNAEPDYLEEWHRAEIIKVVNEKTVLVSFADYGTITRVKKNQLRFLHRSFQYFPIQAFKAELAEIVPLVDGKKWPVTVSERFLELLRIPYLEAKIVEINYKTCSSKVILYDRLQKSVKNLNRKLVLEHLARYTSNTKEKFIADCIEKKMEEGKNCAQSLVNSSIQSPDREVKTRNDAVNISEITNVSFEFEEVPDLPVVENKNENLTVNTKEDGFGIKELLNSLPQTEPLVTDSIPPEKVTCSVLQSMTQENIPLVQTNLKRPPPGLRQPEFNLAERSFSMVDRNVITQKINFLALEILTNNLNIRQVAAINPELAHKIATEMATAYLGSMTLAGFPLCQPYLPFASNLFNPSIMIPPAICNTKINQNIVNPTPIVVSNVSVSVLEEKTNKAKCQVQLHEEKSKTISTSESCAESKIFSKTKDCVKEINIKGKTIHIINLDDGQKYFFVEEILHEFTIFSNREIADRILQAKRITVEYKLLTKKNNKDVLKDLNRNHLQAILEKKKKKKMEVYLIKVEATLFYLKSLGCQTGSYEAAFREIAESSNNTNTS